MFPMFHEIFSKLGYNVLLSDATNEDIIGLSQEYSFEETCFPVKLINGHVAWLLDRKVDYIFLPHLAYYETCWFKCKRRLCMCIYADFTKDN